MTIEWNKVTWYSKLVAVILFLVTFGIAFRLGVLYKEVQILNTDIKNLENTDSEKISRDFSLKIGSERIIGKLKIKLLDVTSDSRCPTRCTVHMGRYSKYCFRNNCRWSSSTKRSGFW